jgi:transposase
MTQSKTYTAEFKRDAPGLAQSTENIAGTARDLGIGLSALRKWIKADQHHGNLAFPGQGRQLLTPEQEELKRLRKESEILRQEREILDRVSRMDCQVFGWAVVGVGPAPS